MMKTYGCAREDLPVGGCFADTRISCAGHSGTHMDAPWHYAPAMNGGEPARAIDEMPIKWCIGDAIGFSVPEPAFLSPVSDARLKSKSKAS